MKRLIVVLCALLMLVTTACAGTAVSDEPVNDVPVIEQSAADHRILVAYLSRSGENYNVGTPKEGSVSASYAGYIEKGNTAILAETVAGATGGDLFAITTVTPYPEDYATMLQVAQDEIDTDARPELAETVENMGDYDVVFIGYPIWHAHLPQAIYSFLESYDLSGKTVIPFNTHEGSGQAGTQRIIENTLPGSTVLQGLAVQGKTAQEDPEKTQALVDEWLEELGMKRVNTDEAAVLAACTQGYEVLKEHDGVKTQPSRFLFDSQISDQPEQFQYSIQFTHAKNPIFPLCL